MTHLFINAFQQWLQTAQPALDTGRITVKVYGPTLGHDKNSMHAELATDFAEATVQLWETGESDFHYLDWQQAEADLENAEVAVTHYEFTRPEELYAALDALVARLSESSLSPQAIVA